MRQVAYSKQELDRNRGRVISVRESMADNNSETFVTKNFVYLVARVDSCPKDIPQPEIRIVKKIDRQENHEGFVYRVKGVVFVKKNRFMYQIRYAHSLNIKVLWKTHVLSMDNPVALA
jgi:hypothetical protein